MINYCRYCNTWCPNDNDGLCEQCWKEGLEDIENEIEHYKDHFRILEDWKIIYDTKSRYKAQCDWNLDKKQATIYEWPKDSEMEEDYICHEMIHIALAEIYDGKTFEEKKKEEHLVRALCGLIFPNE